MADVFRAQRPFTSRDFPPAKKAFLIVEVFGYDKMLPTVMSRDAFNNRTCPFAGNQCEKFLQYGYGYCSVEYKSKYDRESVVYAVCDHRLDGGPVQHAVRDHFDDISNVRIVGELKFTNPDQSFDYVAIDPNSNDFVVVETQAIDLRGGGVGPAWLGIFEGHPADWRALYSAEANRKGRKDNVAYGVNMANITKRLGLQVAEKASLLKGIGAKLYVVAQDRCFDYLRSRIRANWNMRKQDAWDIAFVTFEYDGDISPDGIHNVVYRQTSRTDYSSFSSALATSTSVISRQDFVRRVREKGGL